jgi:hypothetical protein
LGKADTNRRPEPEIDMTEQGGNKTTEIPILVVDDKIEVETVRFTNKGKWVEWKCETHNWEVDFGTESPFAGPTISGDAGLPNKAKVKDKAKLRPYRYKYIVRVPGMDPLDPELIVDA